MLKFNQGNIMRVLMGIVLAVSSITADQIDSTVNGVMKMRLYRADQLKVRLEKIEKELPGTALSTNQDFLREIYAYEHRKLLPEESASLSQTALKPGRKERFAVNGLGETVLPIVLISERAIPYEISRTVLGKPEEYHLSVMSKISGISAVTGFTAVGLSAIGTMFGAFALIIENMGGDIDGEKIMSIAGTSAAIGGGVLAVSAPIYFISIRDKKRSETSLAQHNRIRISREIHR